MDDLVILLVFAVLTGLYLIHRTLYDTVWEKAQIFSFLAASNTFTSFPPDANTSVNPVLTDHSSAGYSLAGASPQVSRALWRAVELVIADFVDPWYRKISVQSAFPNDVRSLFDHIFNVIGSRTRKIDWTVFTVRNILNNLNYLLKIYRLTEHELIKNNPFYAATHTPPSVKHRLLRAELVRTYKLHPGVSDPDKYLRSLGSAILSRLLLPSDYRCDVLRHLLLEMLNSFVLKVSMSFVDPYWMNVGLIKLLKKYKDMEKKQQEQEQREQQQQQQQQQSQSTEDGASHPSTTQFTDGQQSNSSSTNRKRKKSDRERAPQGDKVGNGYLSTPRNAFHADGLSSLSPVPPQTTRSLPKSNSFGSLAVDQQHSRSPPASPLLAASSSTTQSREEQNGDNNRDQDHHSRDREEHEQARGTEHGGEQDGTTEQDPSYEQEGVETDTAAESHSHTHNGPEADTANSSTSSARTGITATDQESLLTAKMLEWKNEKEKRKERQSLASSKSFDGLADMKDKPQPQHLQLQHTRSTQVNPNTPSNSNSSNVRDLHNANSSNYGLSASMTPHPPRPSSPSLSNAKESTLSYKSARRSGQLALPAAFTPNFTSVPLSAITSNWEVTIAGAGIKFDPKPFVAYQLLVKNGSTQGSVLSWTLIKRYNQFEDLHSKLKKSMPASFDAQLPKKHFFGNLDTEFIKQRKKELDKYLSQLLWNQHVLNSEDLRWFLIPNEKDFKEQVKQAEKAQPLPASEKPSSSSSSLSTPQGAPGGSSTTSTTASNQQQLLQQHVSHSHSHMSGFSSSSASSSSSSSLDHHIRGGISVPGSSPTTSPSASTSSTPTQPSLISSSAESSPYYASHSNPHSAASSLGTTPGTFLPPPQLTAGNVALPQTQSLSIRRADSVGATSSTTGSTGDTALSSASSILSAPATSYPDSKLFLSHTETGANGPSVQTSIVSSGDKLAFSPSSSSVNPAASALSTTVSLTSPVSIPAFSRSVTEVDRTSNHQTLGQSSIFISPPSSPRPALHTSQTHGTLSTKAGDHAASSWSAHPQPAPPDTPAGVSARVPSAAPPSANSTTRVRRGSRVSNAGFSAASAAAQSSAQSAARLTRAQSAVLLFEKEMSQNLYIFVEEMFDLNTKGFVRRQAAWITKQIVKLTANNVINAWLKNSITQFVSDESLVIQIEWMTELLWPNGSWRPSSAPLTEAQKEIIKVQACTMLLSSIPPSLKTLLGTSHCESAMTRFFQFLQMEPLIQHFAFSVLDMLCLTIFPELKGQLKPK